MKTILISLLLLFNSCTIAVNCLHTEGTATDLIDEEQAANPNISPDVKVSTLPG